MKRPSSSLCAPDGDEAEIRAETSFSPEHKPIKTKLTRSPLSPI